MKRLFAAACAALLIAGASAQSGPRDPGQGPKVEAEKKSHSGAQAQPVADTPQSNSSKPASAVPIVVAAIQKLPAEPKGEHGGEDGSEFWPPFFGYRVKVTDSLLVLFTLLLWIATRALVMASDPGWKGHGVCLGRGDL